MAAKTKTAATSPEVQAEQPEVQVEVAQAEPTEPSPPQSDLPVYPGWEQAKPGQSYRLPSGNTIVG